MSLYRDGTHGDFMLGNTIIDCLPLIVKELKRMNDLSEKDILDEVSNEIKSLNCCDANEDFNVGWNKAIKEVLKIILKYQEKK